ncbi:MAG: methyl-accepting chemotaxis protein [Geobacter sp.]|nr:methyl-accepting chemotaxis protein [Geobacter sp.]
MLKAYLSSLRKTMVLMISFGLAMGIIFPFYSALFFGSRAFTPWYIAGCLIAGLLVGLFCWYIIKQALKLQLERQFSAISCLVGTIDDGETRASKDELELIQFRCDMLLKRMREMMTNVKCITDAFLIKYRQLEERSQVIVFGNDKQLAKEQENLQSMEQLTDFFGILLKEIEELTLRSDERASITAEMSATTDVIAENIREYSDTVTNTSSSIEEMAASIKEISANIEALSSSTEQTSSSIQQISSAINNVRDNTQKAVESSVNVRMLAQDGMRAMSATLKAMHEIEQNNEESYNAISRLAVHSARVGEFVKVIQEVVEQTNLLSLNASIIAAQAGERGKAFAVVAEEVRSLAHRTSASATEIQELVKNIQKETASVQRAIAQGKDRGKGGVKISAVTSDALAKIESTSTEVAQMIQKIAASTVKQAAGSRVISEEADKNLERVRQVTRAVKEQERGTMMIVEALENLRELSHRIITSTREQTQGNRLYLHNILNDNEKIKLLHSTALKQHALVEELKTSIGESGFLMQDNVFNGQQIMQQISALINEIYLLQQAQLPISHPAIETPAPPIGLGHQSSEPAIIPEAQEF